MSIKNNTTSLQQLLEAVNNLPNVGSGGIELPELTNPADADEIFLNKEVIDKNGRVKIGTFTIDNEINTQEDLLSELRAALSGKASGSGEQVEWSMNENAIVTRTLSSYYNDKVTEIGCCAFYSCAYLTSINFPACTSIYTEAFRNCFSLTSVSFPACTSIGENAFRNCYNLTSISFPVCTNICTGAFYNCYNLSSLTLGTSTICKLSNSGAFYSTPFTGYSAFFSGTPYIYVPASLVSAYQSATNWTYFSSYITAIPSDH